MQIRSLGPHSVGAIGFGAMSLGGAFGPTTEAESLLTLDAAWDAGITHFDTANIYGMGTSEEAIGAWLKSRGHPIGATGVSQHVMAAMQLVGEAGDMQLEGANLAGVFNMGGAAVTNYVSILERMK